MLTVALNVSVFVKRVHFFQEALGLNSPQTLAEFRFVQFLSCFETKRREQE